MPELQISDINAALTVVPDVEQPSLLISDLNVAVTVAPTEAAPIMLISNIDTAVTISVPSTFYGFESEVTTKYLHSPIIH